MPTERFKRLPREKIGAIRRAGIREFTRTAPESASINRIIQDADISRGSFYTYFESKYDLLQWLISDRIREHNDFYERDLEENGGDIWLTLSRALEYTIAHANDGGFLGMIVNLIESRTFFELFKESAMEPGQRDCKKSRLERLYGSLDKERFPMDFTVFSDLMDLHAITLMMALKRLFHGECEKEEAVGFYTRRLRLLRYGVCAPETERKNKMAERGDMQL